MQDQFINTDDRQQTSKIYRKNTNYIFQQLQYNCCKLQPAADSVNSHNQYITGTDKSQQKNYRVSK